MRNLWLDDETSFIHIGDDISADLDVAMMVRRTGIPGQTVPDGILTRLENTALGGLLQTLESRENPKTIDLGFYLLTLGEDTILDVSKQYDRLVKKAKNDGKGHDISFAAGGSGLTIHINDSADQVAATSLRNHCERRKYSQKARVWFGVCVSPNANGNLRFGINLETPWEHSEELEATLQAVEQRSQLKRVQHSRRARAMRKIGRNEPCPCGSGKKYKKCCGK